MFASPAIDHSVDCEILIEYIDLDCGKYYIYGRIVTNGGRRILSG